MLFRSGLVAVVARHDSVSATGSQNVLRVELNAQPLEDIIGEFGQADIRTSDVYQSGLTLMAALPKERAVDYVLSGKYRYATFREAVSFASMTNLPSDISGGPFTTLGACRGPALRSEDVRNITYPIFHAPFHGRTDVSYLGEPWIPENTLFLITKMPEVQSR